MKYIVVDFEWNQPLSAEMVITDPIRFDSEIIEIGAIRLNEDLTREDEFKSYVRPRFYPLMNDQVGRLTRISAQMLSEAPSFPEAFARFADWCGDDFCLCTWGGNDVPVLLDNMLMHGLETPERFLWCDIQHIFGSETMRDHRRWSLEDAVKFFALPKDRAHDALNDVRNTCRICERVDILPYVEEYLVITVHYGPDKRNGLLDGRLYPSLEEAVQDTAMCSLPCPYCGEQVLFGEWAPESVNSFLSYGCCGEGDEFLARFHHKRKGLPPRVSVRRSVFEMTDALWEHYQDTLEQAETLPCPTVCL